MRRSVLPFCLLLAACGQTGPLVLPGSAADAKGSAAPAAAGSENTAPAPATDPATPPDPTPGAAPAAP